VEHSLFIASQKKDLSTAALGLVARLQMKDLNKTSVGFGCTIAEENVSTSMLSLGCSIGEDESQHEDTWALVCHCRRQLSAPKRSGLGVPSWKNLSTSVLKLGLE